MWSWRLGSVTQELFAVFIAVAQGNEKGSSCVAEKRGNEKVEKFYKWCWEMW